MPEENPEEDVRRRRDPNEDARARQKAAAARIEQQSTWVDLQLRQAIERGDFENLPGYGKPLRDLGSEHDPDWWVKRLLEREQITGVLPPSLQLRKEDAALDGVLDRLPTETEVRREVEEFNARVRWALYRPPEGPPMVTPQRDPDTEVERWAERRRERQRRRLAAQEAERQAQQQARGAESGRRHGRRWPRIRGR